MLPGWYDTIVADPATVDFHRSSPTHMTFGAGPHVCAGQHLARREVRIVLQEWLERIPDFSLAEGAELRLGTGWFPACFPFPCDGREKANADDHADLTTFALKA